MARIDPSIVRKLLAGALEGADDVAVVYPGEPDPEKENHWARLVSVDIRGNPKPMRNSGVNTEPDLARIVVVVSVCSSVAASDPTAGGGAWAHGAAVNRVALVLDGANMSDADTTHKVELFRTDVREDPPGEQRGLRSSVITVEGLAQRLTGSGLSALAADPG